ncbi:MAG: hypothetical protein SGI73_02480 [Chloroflexota bacterium]|nr:hypothetical protein [Chloroflexota bacterium]
MNVYVETNFVLELTLLQEEMPACERILTLAETDAIRLILPAYALIEPYETLIRRGKARRQLASNVETELRELGRSVPYQAQTKTFAPFIDLLSQSASDELQRLQTHPTAATSIRYRYSTGQRRFKYTLVVRNAVPHTTRRGRLCVGAGSLTHCASAITLFFESKQERLFRTRC